MSAVNESLIRDVVAEVLGRLGGAPAAAKPATPEPAAASCGCGGKGAATSAPGLRGKFGVFQDANEASAAAHESFLQLQKAGVAARVKIVEIVKAMAEANAEAWGKIELEESKIGRLDHKIEKLKIIKLVPGVEWLRPDARSGDHGITLEEYTPFGVVGAVTPSTHSIPTLSGNIVSIRVRHVARRLPFALTTRRSTARPALRTSRRSSRSPRWRASPRCANTRPCASCW
jgi:aldehyde dehydrogenase